MAQVREQQRLHQSPIHPRIRPLPDATLFLSSPSNDMRRTQSLRTFDQPSYPRTPLRGIHAQSILNQPPLTPLHPPHLDQMGTHYPSDHAKYDTLTGLIINASSTATNPNENHEPAYVSSSSFDRRPSFEREQPPPVPPRALDNPYSFQQQYAQSRLHRQLNETEEMLDLPALDDDDGLPTVSVDSKSLPVFARFPFDVSFLPQTMETNVEDNIHRLRLRLIDSELNHQRRSTDEYLKRTQEQHHLRSSKSREQSIYHARPPTNSVAHQRLTPKHLSRQGSYARLSIGTPMIGTGFPSLSRGRIGMDYEPRSNTEVERDLEIRQTQDSLYNDRRPNQQLVISNYSYDPRLNLQPMDVLERQYTSSNMDDLIDSMARRHLASRRFDPATDRQRLSSRGYGPYYESAAIARQASFQNQQHNEDLFFINTTPSSQIEHNFLRTYPNDVNPLLRSTLDHSYRRPSDFDSANIENTIGTNSYPKLPPITPGLDSNRLDRSAYPSTSALYRAKHYPREHRTYQPSVPLNLPDHLEHLVELPSDIYLSSRTEAVGSSRRHRQTPQSKPRSISEDKSGVSLGSEQEQFDGENKSETTHQQWNEDKPEPTKKSATLHHQWNEDKPDQEKKSAIIHRRKKEIKTDEEKIPTNATDGFFTEEKPPETLKPKPKRRRPLFQKAALGIIFIHILQRRAAQNRRNRPSQTSSATIHKIRLQEILVALHRVYLEPDGPIYNALIQVATSPIELKDALNTSATNHGQAMHIIGDALKNIISKIVDFMPKDGVLGTTNTSAIAALIQDGSPFPDNYFWQCEKQLLEFKNSKILNVTKQRAILLLMGIFIFRALVTTLLLKPTKYRLMLGQLTPNQSANLKVLASAVFYVGRRTAGSNSQTLTLPHEWESLIYSEADIKPIIQHAGIKSIMTTCELSLRIWCEEYISRIDASFGKELRS